MWYLYILKCSDGKLYTGITTDVAKRIERHNLKKASKCTRVRVPVELVYQEPHPSRSSASKREYEIKQWPRRGKEALFNKQPVRATLSKKRTGPMIKLA